MGRVYRRGSAGRPAAGVERLWLCTGDVHPGGSLTPLRTITRPRPERPKAVRWTQPRPARWGCRPRRAWEAREESDRVRKGVLLGSAWQGCTRASADEPKTTFVGGMAAPAVPGLSCWRPLIAPERQFPGTAALDSRIV